MDTRFDEASALAAGAQMGVQPVGWAQHSDASRLRNTGTAVSGERRHGVTDPHSCLRLGNWYPCRIVKDSADSSRILNNVDAPS